MKEVIGQMGKMTEEIMARSHNNAVSESSKLPPFYNWIYVSVS